MLALKEENESLKVDRYGSAGNAEYLNYELMFFDNNSLNQNKRGAILLAHR